MAQFDTVLKLHRANAADHVLEAAIRSAACDTAFSMGQNGLGSLLFRAVRWTERPTRVDQVGYPRPEHVKTAGRANTLGQPDFYACAHPASPYQEIGLKAGETFCLSVWKIAQPFVTIDLGYKHSADLPASNRNRFEPIDLHSQKFFEFAGEEFLRQSPVDGEPDYRLSSLISKVLLNDFTVEPGTLPTRPGEPVRAVGGISYPSIASRYFRENVALLPAVVDACLVLQEVHFGKALQSVNEGPEVLFEASDKAVEFGEDGQIHWLNLAPRVQRIRVEPLVKVEGGRRWVAQGQPYKHEAQSQ
jgi:hypothetical protein